MRLIGFGLLIVFSAACTNASKLDLSEAGGRAMWQRPDDVVRLLGLEPGDAVADLGAGDGYFEPYLSGAVGPDGEVYAVEVDPEVVPNLESAMAELELDNVKVVVGEYTDPMLPDGEIDVVLLVNSTTTSRIGPSIFGISRRISRPVGAWRSSSPTRICRAF